MFWCYSYTIIRECINWCVLKLKGKGTVHPCTGTEALYRPYGPWGVEVYLYSFLTTALEGGEGSRHAPVAPYPQERTGTHCSGPQGRSGQVWKISPPPGFDPRTVQHAASCYTKYDTRLTLLKVQLLKWSIKIHWCVVNMMVVGLHILGL